MNKCLTKHETSPLIYECLICYEEKEKHDKVKLACNHELCERCYQEIEKRNSSCPFCRAPIEINDPDPEEWLDLDPRDWIVYSKTDQKYGQEKIYVYRSNEIQPGWRNDAIVLSNKRTRQRKKRFWRNK